MRKVFDPTTDIIEFSTLESRCVYLPNERMKMEYKYIKNCDFELNSDLVQHGWRRFGHYYSRPACNGCTKCLSLRVDVNRIETGRSVRRLYRKNRETKIVVKRPSVSYAHLKLYEKYHRHMQRKKGWDYYPVTAESYHDLYAKGFSTYGLEVLYLRDGKLVGVDLIDMVRDGISSIYFYYDPDYAHLGLGNYSIYKQVDFAREKGLAWIYLGYYVEACESLNYKAKYRPHQILFYEEEDGREKAIWREVS